MCLPSVLIILLYHICPKKAIGTLSLSAEYSRIMKTIEYDAEAAVAYAGLWAYRRNPYYYDFSRIGGDCTNFVSQCLFAGGSPMNYTPVTGWYYATANDRTASWTGVEFFYRFLIGNQGVGPFAEETDAGGVHEGDVIQLGRATGDFYHTCLVVGFQRGVPLVAAHSYDTFAKPLSAYIFEKVRFLHIAGARTDQ